MYLNYKKGKIYIKLDTHLEQSHETITLNKISFFLNRKNLKLNYKISASV